MTKAPGINPIGKKGKSKIMIFGISGAGKTRLIGSTPGRTLIIRPPTDHTTSIDVTLPGATIDEWVVKDWSAMAEVEDYCRTDGIKEYDWYWLDSVSLMQDTLLDDVWKDAKVRNPKRGLFGMDKQEYGINMGRLSEWLRGFIAIDRVNIGVTAHPFELEAAGGFEIGKVEEGDTLLMPWVQGKNMSMKFCGYMNAVWYLRVVRNKKTGKPQRELITDIMPREFGATIYAKNQLFTSASSKMIDPTMSQILEKIKAGGRANTAARPATKRPTGRPVVRKAK